MIEHNEVLEWAEYVGNYYGTPRKPVEDALSKGLDVILEIEVQGAMKIKQKCPDAVFIFNLPPSMEILEKRLRGRGTDSEEVIKKRLETAKWEISQASKYDYIVVNDELEVAVDEFLAVIKGEKCNVKRNSEFIASFNYA